MARNTAPEARGIQTASIRALATVYAGSAPGANTDIFTAVSVSESASAIRITVALTTSSVFDVRVTDGSTAYTIHLNGGTALAAATMYTFTFGARAYSTQTGTTALTYSCRVATDSIINYLLVEEVCGPVV